MNKLTKYHIVLVLVILFYCLDYYFRISPSLIVTQLMNQYQLSPLGIGAFASVFYTAYLLFQIPSGFCLQRYPLNMVLIVTILLCTFSFIVFINSHNVFIGYLSRFLIGALSAFSFVSVLFIAGRYFPQRWFAFISGLTIAAGTLAASVVQVISSALMQYINWHWIISFFACWGIVVAGLLLLPGLRIKQDQGRPVFLQQNLWAQCQQFFSKKILVMNGVVGGLFYLPTTIFASLWGIAFLQQNYHYSAITASTGITLLFLGWAVGSPLIGLLSGFVKHFKIIMSGSALLAAAVSFLLIYNIHISIIYVYSLLFLFGLFSSAQVLVWQVFSNCCAPEIKGIGVALTNMIIMLSSAIFHLIVGALLSLTQTTINFQLGLSIIPIAFLIVSIMALCFKQIREKNDY